MDNRSFGGIALGDGLIRPLIAAGSEEDVLRGQADLLTKTNQPPWLAFKTLWFSEPSYQGAFIIRAQKLDGPGPIGMEYPTETMLIVPAGPTVNGVDGYREAPGSTWVMGPGCYAWQVDGLTFTEVIVVNAVLP